MAGKKKIVDPNLDNDGKGPATVIPEEVEGDVDNSDNPKGKKAKTDSPPDDMDALLAVTFRQVDGGKILYVEIGPRYDSTNQPAFMDEGLMGVKGMYPFTNCLSEAQAKTWSKAEPEVDEEGQVVISAMDCESWKVNNRNVSDELLGKILLFAESGNIFSPARADVTRFAARRSVNKFMSKRPGEEKVEKVITTLDVMGREGLRLFPVLFMSLIIVADSSVTAARFPESENGMVYRFIEGLGHKAFLDRTLAFFPMIVQQEVITCQMDAERNIQYQTKHKFSNEAAEDEFSQKNTSPKKKFVKASYSASPTKKSSSSMSPLAPLTWKSEIPVFDARKVDFDFSDVEGSMTRCPTFTKEVPIGSCVCVTYTASAMQTGDNPWKLNFWIRNVILFATP
ncbi:hypothetical protein DFP72DRAFT_1082205 [Ephemerocybe angulata]|uniref:Uncharacterized protein n=1 Tax=Ephemerocybe angulata TaxID=980116 RepID=A0A8H6LVG0_9AGAR|nr:hypothetical protein DFP72DRAFT_1082205 [Tulosesus angulatus]